MTQRMMARLGMMLQGIRGGSAAGDTRAESRLLRRRLTRARVAARTWKGRAADAIARAREAAGQLAVAQEMLRGARTRAAFLQHEAASPEVVREMFAHRLRTLTARHDDASRRAREEDLLSVSHSYAAAVARTHAPPHPLVQRTSLDGLSWWIPVRAAEDGLNQRWIDTQRFPYRGILQTREVATGGIMLDIGASLGRMAIPRVVLGDVTAAYCAEPDPMNFACLAANVVDNGLRGLVMPDQTAIGDRDGVERLLCVGSSGRFHIVPGAAEGMEHTIEVPCCTLDTWVERLRIDLQAVTFIKVDVEGFERRVLAGARRLLECRHVAWQMEVKPSGLRAAGDDPRTLYADLQRCFTHFVDLNRRARGPRVRPIDALAEALGYVEPDRKTDLLLFSLSS
jgi:FkbM family methyltransferase